MRPSGRAPDQMRDIMLETGVSRYAEGSCLAKFGHTHVLCTASVEQGVPRWMKGKGKGWVTGEYGMLPRATHTRGRREAAQGKQSGRTQEIQRLIGRAALGGRHEGAGRAHHHPRLRRASRPTAAPAPPRSPAPGSRSPSPARTWSTRRCSRPIRSPARSRRSRAASSTDAPVLDLDYAEDSSAEVDANFVLAGDGRLIEIQATGEQRPFSEEEFAELMRLAKLGCSQLFEAQRKASA